MVVAVVLALAPFARSERVAEALTLRPGTTLTLEELQSFCRGKLGGFNAGVSDEVKSKVETAIAAMKDGSLKPGAAK